MANQKNKNKTKTKDKKTTLGYESTQKEHNNLVNKDRKHRNIANAKST